MGESEAHLGNTLDFGRLVRVVVVDVDRELERAALVHACRQTCSRVSNSPIVAAQERRRKRRALECRRKTRNERRLTLVRRDRELKVEEVLGVGEVGLHRRREVELGQVWEDEMGELGRVEEANGESGGAKGKEGEEGAASALGFVRSKGCYTLNGTRAALD